MNPSPTPFRIIGKHKGDPVYLHAYPTHVEITCKGLCRRFNSYEQAMGYLQAIARKEGGNGRNKGNKEKLDDYQA